MALRGLVDKSCLLMISRSEMGILINWKTVVMSSLTLYSPNVISGVRWRVLIRKPCVILKQNLWTF
jgi:hypothetical protein